MIKQLFFSITLFNFTSSLFCMSSMLQRMRLALPSAICVARMPKPHLMPQRNLIYGMYGTHGSKSNPEPHTILASLVSYSIQAPVHKFQKTLNISTKAQLQFVKIDAENRYFAFETEQDAQNIASGEFNIDGYIGITAINKNTGFAPKIFDKPHDLKFIKTEPGKNHPEYFRWVKLPDGKYTLINDSPTAIKLDKGHITQWFYYRDKNPAK